MAERLLDSLVIDSSKIRRELEWAQPFIMGQGLAEAALWYNAAIQGRAQAKGPDTSAIDGW